MEDIVFVTTALHTKWLTIQQALIKKFFPKSKSIVIDGRSSWPNSWFWWIEKVKNRKEKWYIHIDEDFFLEDSNEIFLLLETMENGNYDLSGISEAFCHFRGNNPVAMNSFFMVGKVKDLDIFTINPSDLRFQYGDQGWSNNLGLHYEEEFLSGFEYPHNKVVEKAWHQMEAEPYYLFFWLMKKNGKKFYYLYPRFDERFRSTNPRVLETRNDIGIHMWYTRNWQSNMDVHGFTNIERYLLVEQHLKKTHNDLF